MATKFDARQVISLDALDHIASGAADTELDNLLRSIDSDLKPLLRLDTDGSLTISVNGSQIINPETDRVTSLPPVNGTIPVLGSGSIVLPATTGNTITVSPGSNATLTLSNSSFIKMGIHLDTSNNLVVNFGSEAGSIAGASAPADIPNALAIGYIVIEADGSGNVQPVTTGRVYQYITPLQGGAVSANQDRNVKMIGGGTWHWDGSSEELSWSSDAYIQIPGLDDTSNTIQSGMATLNANEVAYVLVNRTTNTPTNLTVQVANINAVPSNNNVVIFARRDGNDVLVGTASFRLKDDERLELDGALAEIARRLDQLKLLLDPSNADQVTISGADITQLDGTVLGQELSNVLMDFTGATINFTTGVITGANGIDFTPFSIPVGQYFWYGIALVGDTIGADNRISASVQVTPATTSNAVAANAELPLIIGSKKLGAVQIYNNSGSLEVFAIRRLGVGSGSGGEGEGGGAPIEPASGFNMAFVDEFDVGSASSDSLVRDTETNASHNLSKGLYQLECDTTPTYTSSGTNITLSGAPSFTMQVGDIIYIDALSEWRRIATVNTQTDVDVDVAFSSALSGDAGMVSQAVWTKDLINNVGDASEKTRPRDFYPNEPISQINVDYFDSLSLDDDVPDFVDDARVVVSASQEGLQADVDFPDSDTFTSIYTRPNAPAQITNYPLSDPGDKERLFLVFFCNPNNASVSANGFANLLKYKVSFYEEETLKNGGVLDSAYCMSDGSATEVNCQAPVVDGGVTYLTLDWGYVAGLRPGETQGDLSVYVNGQEIPRFVSGATVDAYYEEVPGNNKQIRFHADLSSSPVSIEVYRRQGSIDTSDQNATDLANLLQSLHVSSGITLDRKNFQRVLTDSSGGPFTIFMPASPQVGDVVRIQDATGSWASNNVTIDRNGNLIETSASNDTLDVNRAWIEYEYYGGAQGWITRT